MSFILDALKKSEHKRKAEHDQEPRVVFDPAPVNTSVSRRWIPLVVLLLLCVVLLLAVLVWQRTGQEGVIPEQRVVDIESPAPEARGAVVMPVVPPSEALPPVLERQPEIEPLQAVAVAEQDDAPVREDSVPETAADQDRLFTIAELPADVRRRLPTLHMALHAYNANDAVASMVQINGRLVREGAQITDNLTVEEITMNGAILRTEGYRFLLPRRGQ